MSAQPKTSTFLPFMTMATNRDLCARTLAQHKLPVENRISTGHFDPTSNKIKVMTMKVNKGLEFPMVALPGVGHVHAVGKEEKEAVRVSYVAARSATQRLVLGVGGGGGFGLQISATEPIQLTSTRGRKV